MCYTGLFRRVIPFVLTFAVGLFIASFFVPIAFPGANWRSGRRMNRFHEIQQLRIENKELREKLRQARMENENRGGGVTEFDPYVIPNAVPPVELDAHHPPPPPRKPKQPRYDNLQ